MRILNVAMSLDAKDGGIVSRTVEMSRGLIRQGHQVVIMTTDKGLSPERVREVGIPLVVYPSLWDRFYIPVVRASEFIREIRSADLVHLIGHWTLLNALVYWVARLLKIPYVFCPAGALPVVGRSKLLKRIYNLLCGHALVRRAAACIAIVEREVDEFVHYGASRDRVHVIPTALDPNEFSSQRNEDIRTVIGLSRPRFILFLGRLSHLKGADILIEAFGKQVNRLPEYDLVMAGPDDEGSLEQLKGIAVRMGIGDRVHFVGMVSGEKKIEALKSADILAVSSRSEAMPTVAIESGMCGTPVLITDRCGFNQIGDVNGGWVVPATVDGVREGLGEALLECSEEQRRQMGENLKIHCIKHYSMNVVTDSYVRLYLAIVAKVRHPSGETARKVEWVLARIETLLSWRLSARHQLILFGLIASGFLAIFLLNTATFFQNLSTTASDYSWGDVSWIHQAFYNFVHGRPLQTSIYYYSGEGNLGNPYAHANQLAMHINLTPYLFTPIYSLFPRLSTLYGIVIFFNFFGFLGLTWLILKFHAPQRSLLRYAFLVSFILACGFFPIISYKALFPLYQGVFVLGLFYARLRGWRVFFGLTTVLFILISDDTPLFALTFAAFLFLYDRRDRFFSLFMAGASLLHLALINLLIYPLVKLDWITGEKLPSDMLIRLKRIFNGSFLPNYADIKAFLWYSMAILACALLFMGKIPGLTLKRALLCIFLAPLSHWFISFVDGGGHHLMPVYALMILGATLLFSVPRTNESVALPLYRLLPIIWIMLLLAFDVHKNRVAPLPDSLRTQTDSNRAVLEYLQRIPADQSVVYWTNRGVDAYAVARNDVWRFPSYYDSADHLVIQKDTTEAFFVPGPFADEANCEPSRLNIGGQEGSPLKNALVCGRHLSGGTAETLDPEIIKRLTSELVDGTRTHLVEFESAHLLVLKRIAPFHFPKVRSTLGFGWVADVPRFLRRHD